MTLEITKMLVLSTGHLTEETCNVRMEDFGYDKKGVGAFVSVGTGDYLSGDEPEDLLACETLARSLDCDWIMFDRDGPTIDELPSYEW